MPESENPAHPEPVEGPKDLTDFTPVPRLKDRSNGWKPEVQRAFIEALADYGSVAAACRVVGRADHGAYQLRRHLEGAEFAAAWDEALAHGVLRLQDSLMERAIHGVPVPVYSYGKLIGERRVYNDRLGMFMLRNRLPELYCEGGARGLNALDKATIERLKKEWLQEQWAADKEDEEEVLADLEQKFATMAHNRKTNMSPAQRAAEIAARAQGLADSAAGWRIGGAYREYADKAAELLPRFIAEVEAEWPPLPHWAWDEPDEEQADPTPARPPPRWRPACPERSRGAEAPEPEEPSGPRVRTLKDDGW